MRTLSLAAWLSPVLLLAAAPAQIQAAYDVYGTGCPGTGTGLGTQHVVPAVYANQFAGGSNAIPFWMNSTRYQQLFLGTELPAAFTIGGFGVRQSPNFLSGLSEVLVDLEIQIGYTTRTPATMSATFADNFDLGTPVTVLPRTLFLFPGMPTTPPSSPSDFVLQIPFPTTLDYVPAPGRNLIVQIVHYGASTPGFAYPMDAGGSSATARLFASPQTSTIGTLEPGYGIVMCLFELTHTAVPILSSKETPQIGNQLPVKLSQARPKAPALLLLGGSDQLFAGLGLPFDLTPVGGTGCALLASAELSNGVTTSSSGTATFTYQIPLALTLLGGRFYNQWVIVDPNANPLGVAFSNAGAGLVGY